MGRGLLSLTDDNDDEVLIVCALVGHLIASGSSLGEAQLLCAVKMVSDRTCDSAHSFTAVLLLAAALGGGAPPPFLPSLGELAAYGALCGPRGATCAPPAEVAAASVPAIARHFAALPLEGRAALRALLHTCLSARPPALPAGAPCCGAALLGAAGAAVCAAGAAGAEEARSAEGGAEALASAMGEAAVLCTPLKGAEWHAGDAGLVVARLAPGALKCLGLAAALLRAAPPLPAPVRALLHGAGRSLQQRIMSLLPLALAD
jgi:hypothetical protein